MKRSYWIVWVDLKPNDKWSYKRHTEEETGTREGDVNTEAGIGVAWPKVKADGSNQKLEEVENGFCSGTSVGSMALLILLASKPRRKLISAVWSCGICGSLHSSPRKLIKLQRGQTVGRSPAQASSFQKKDPRPTDEKSIAILYGKSRGLAGPSRRPDL